MQISREIKWYRKPSREPPFLNPTIRIVRMMTDSCSFSHFQIIARVHRSLCIFFYATHPSPPHHHHHHFHTNTPPPTHTHTQNTQGPLFGAHRPGVQKFFQILTHSYSVQSIHLNDKIFHYEHTISSLRVIQMCMCPYCPSLQSAFEICVSCSNFTIFLYLLCYT